MRKNKLKKTIFLKSTIFTSIDGRCYYFLRTNNIDSIDYHPYSLFGHFKHDFNTAYLIQRFIMKKQKLLSSIIFKSNSFNKDFYKARSCIRLKLYK